MWWTMSFRKFNPTLQNEDVKTETAKIGIGSTHKEICMQCEVKSEG